MQMNMNMDTFVPIGSPSGQRRACTCGEVLTISSVDSAWFQHEQDENLYLEDISLCNSASSTWLPSAHIYCNHFCTRTRVWTDFPLLPYKRSPGSSASTSINSKYLFLQVLFFSLECRARWWVGVPGQYFTEQKSASVSLILTDERGQWWQHQCLPNANTLSLLYKHAQWVQTLQPLGRRTSAQLQPPACLATGPPPQPSPSKCVDFSTHFIWKEKRAVGQGQPWPVQRPRRGSLKAVPCSLTTYLTEEAPWSPVMWFLHLKLSSASECQCFRVCVSFFLAADGNLVIQQLCQVEPARFDVWTKDFLLHALIGFVKLMKSRCGNAEWRLFIWL